MIMCTYKQICISNRSLVQGDFLQQIKKVTQSGIDFLILREKDLPECEYQLLAKQVIEICEQNQVTCILHSFDRAADALSYPRLHVTMDKLRYMSEMQRQKYTILGVSTHSVEEAIEAQRLGATYITASHIFPTDCKKGLAPRGLSYLQEVKNAVSIPVYALGGITPENTVLCREAGADGACMMSYYMKM